MEPSIYSCNDLLTAHVTQQARALVCFECALANLPKLDPGLAVNTHIFFVLFSVYSSSKSGFDLEKRQTRMPTHKTDMSGASLFRASTQDLGEREEQSTYESLKIRR